MNTKNLRWAWVAIGFLTLPLSTHALDWGVIVQAESEYTTNTARTSDDEVEEWVHRPGVQLQATHSGPSYDLDVDYTFAREIYEEDLFDDENVASGSADLVWRALPERLDFVVSHSRTQSTIRAIESLTPDNRQETVNTSAGPILRFNPRGQDTIEFQYEWADSSSDDTDDDSITHELSARYGLAWSTNNILTFEVIQREVQYDNEFIPDLEYTIGQVLWDRTARDVTYALQGGYTEVERDDRDDVDGFTFDLNIAWQVSPRDQLTFEVGRELRDESRALGSGVFDDELFFEVDSDLGEVFTNERAGIEWQRQIDGRTNLQIAAQYDEEDYEDALRDVERIGYTVSLDRQLTRNVSISVSLGYDEEDFSDEGDEQETTRGDLDLSWQASPRLELTVGARYEEQESETTGTGRAFDEWIGFVRLGYALRQLRDGGGR